MPALSIVASWRVTSAISLRCFLRRKEGRCRRLASAPMSCICRMSVTWSFFPRRIVRASFAVSASRMPLTVLPSVLMAL